MMSNIRDRLKRMSRTTAGPVRVAARPLIRDRRGSALSIMTMSLIPILAALGAGIDAARMYVVKSQLQTGVDAAALAGARAFSVTDGSSTSRTGQVDAYFYGNFPKAPVYMGVKNLTLNSTFTTVDGINQTVVTAYADVPMSLMQIFGFGNQRMTATAKAELQPRPLEAMLVLDNTGSMRSTLSGGKTRITALKEAANSFLDILYQGSSTRRDLAIGIVPYDITVNVGGLLPSGAVANVDGINSGTVMLGGSWPSNRYAWKGCVMNDSTVRDVSSDRLVSETNAWDLTRVLPGEGSNPAVRPYYVPPMYVPNVAAKSATAALKADPASIYYQYEGIGTSPGVEAAKNLFRLDKGSVASLTATYLANSAAYRQHFYDAYIGLNNGSGTSTDDVIRMADGSYWNPTSTATDWVVDWNRIPNYSNSVYWSDPADGVVNKNGGVANDITKNRTDAPSPNWQCPEQAIWPVYNRAKSFYTDYIRDKNAAIYPGNGTIHHSGLLWGYRLLVRDDKFTRSNPTNERPRRAIVFMTDGLNEVDEDQNGYLDRTFTWYGRWSDKSISANASDTETQMLRRFAKTCANIQRETNPPEVYIIALVANSNEVDTAFNACAPGRVYRTSNTDELKKAFQDVAAELVDLHLIQ